MAKKTIGIACDHAGFKLKEELIKNLQEQGYSLIDFGTYSEESCDYPDYAHPLAISVKNGESNIGFSICGSGNGITMTVNKHAGIRGALCWTEEISVLARQHNDANICGIPARFVTTQQAISIVNSFLNTSFEGGRHLGRIKKIDL